MTSHLRTRVGRTTGLAAIALAGLLTAGGVGNAADVPKVMVTVKPVHGLVAAVMGDVGKPSLLLDGGGSPHFYSLRPSEAAAIRASDLVVWVGEDLERFMEQPIAALAGRATVLELATTAGVVLLPTRSGGEWEEEDADDDDRDDDHAGHGHGAHDAHAHAEGHDHAHGADDMHLWLDPRNARAIVDAVATALAGVDPERGSVYRANAARARADIDGLEARLRARLAPVRAVPYVVFHDAYQYYERAFGLNAVGSITVNPEAAPGAKRLFELRRRIVDLDVRCVFSEPQFEPRLVSTMLEGTSARPGVLDPLGAAVPAGPDAYARVMTDLADSLVACLGG